MNKLKNIFFTLIVFFSCMFCVNASCTDEELEILKKEANNIKVTYKHKGVIEDDGVVFYNRFDIIVKNINDDFYFTYSGYGELIPNAGTASTVLESGQYTFEVNSKKCDIVVDEIFVKIPRFNVYSLDPLCSGIDGDDFPLCGKYYDYQVDYDDFYIRVNNYRTTHNIADSSFDIDEEKSNMFEFIVNFLSQYYICIIAFLVSIILLIIIILLIVRRKKIGNILK